MFPRTLTEAFDDPIERAKWWYPPEEKYGWVEIVMWWVTACVWVCLGFIFFI
jgi:hypothetical protein